MFVRIVTVPVLKETFTQLESICEDIIEKVFPALEGQEGWFQTCIVFNEEEQ